MTVGEGAEPWPTEIRLTADRRALMVAFDDGSRFELPAELLRVESPSAEVQGHQPSEKKLVAGKRDVAITSVEPVGNYAVKLAFSDGHTTGIYGWRYLREMGLGAAELLRSYRERLAAAGLTAG